MSETAIKRVNELFDAAPWLLHDPEHRIPGCLHVTYSDLAALAAVPDGDMITPPEPHAPAEWEAAVKAEAERRHPLEDSSSFQSNLNWNSREDFFEGAEYARSLASTVVSTPPEPVGVTREAEFEVWQDDMPVAECSGLRERALRDAMHYAAVYGQDGPVEVFEVTRTLVAVGSTEEET